MRKSLLTVATAGLLALTSVNSVFAQPIPTPEVAQTAAISACASGTPAACSAALTALVEAIRAANPTASIATVTAAVTSSFQAVREAVEASGGSAANIAAVDTTLAESVPSVTEDEDQEQPGSAN